VGVPPVVIRMQQQMTNEFMIKETDERCVQTCGRAPASPYVCVKITEGERTGKELWIHKDKLARVESQSPKREKGGRNHDIPSRTRETYS